MTSAASGTSRGAYAVWGAALAVYILAIFHRSSLGVAGLLAVDRFGISATQLATFTVLQMLVYASMQIPVGVLLDRFGSRRLLVVGLVMMTGAQLAFALTTSYAGAVAARVVLGAGDAMIFVSIIRLVAFWFGPRQAPVLTQLTGQLGQLGAIAAAAPLSIALRELGWTATFAGVSSIGLLLLVGLLLFVRDSPVPIDRTAVIRLAALARSVRTVWGNPGTRLGMWSHFTSQFSAAAFALLWGFPFLVAGQGISENAAGVLLMVMTGWVLVSGLVLGVLVARLPYYRSVIVLLVVALVALTWTVVLLWDGPAPMWLLVVLVCAMATGGPASMIGFDLQRTFSPAMAAGRANGLVNGGGFVATLVTMWLIGLLLDLRSPGTSSYDLGDFKVAMCAQYLLWVLGAAQIWRYRRKALAHLERVHPGAAEQMRRGQPFVHPGMPDAGGV